MQQIGPRQAACLASLTKWTSTVSKTIGTLGQADLNSGNTLSMVDLRAMKMISNLQGKEKVMHCTVHNTKHVNGSCCRCVYTAKAHGSTPLSGFLIRSRACHVLLCNQQDVWFSHLQCCSASSSIVRDHRLGCMSGHTSTPANLHQCLLPSNGRTH